jgi:hypothetical protein
VAQYELGKLRQKTEEEEEAHVRRATKVSVQSELGMESAWAMYTACLKEGERFLDCIDPSWPDDDEAEPSMRSAPVAAIPSSRTMRTTGKY